MAMTPEQVQNMMQALMDSQATISAELQRQQADAILANQSAAAKAAESANAALMDSMKSFIAAQMQGKSTAEQQQQH